ncbi:MAG: replication factor C large subunit [Nanoarchaeota archaeon]|nr:replication factor C large subunit [Nanoarchaeota archaeon]
MKPWCEKYRPMDDAELATDPVAVNELKAVIKKKGIAMIYGNSGTCKTSTVEAIANGGNYEIVEMNASDFRDSESIKNVIGGGLGQQSLFQKEKIILIDEINGISGREDRGGVQALSKLLMNNYYPVIMTAEDPYVSKINVLRKKSKLIEFKPIDSERIVGVLKNICESEKIKYSDESLKIIARRVGGDIRGAINDLQIHAANGILEVSDDSEENEREREGRILEALMLVFKSTKWENFQGAYDNVRVDHKEIMLWLDQNIPYEYRGKELFSAYDALSRADIFNRRIMRWQYWRYLVYVYQLLSSGIALAKNESKKGFVKYKRSSRPLKIWMSNQKNFKRKTISEKVSSIFHTSMKSFIKEDLPYLKLMARHNKLPELKLEPEEIEWLKK